MPSLCSAAFQMWVHSSRLLHKSASLTCVTTLQVSSCKTWSGKGDATEGEFVPAADLTFTIDTDATTGQETITVTELKQARRQGALYADGISAQRHAAWHRATVPEHCDVTQSQLMSWLQQHDAKIDSNDLLSTARATLTYACAPPPDGFLAGDVMKFNQIVSDLSVPIDALQSGAALRPQALPAY